MALAGTSALAAASAYFDGTMLGSVFNGPKGYIGEQICTSVAAKAKSTELQITIATPQLAVQNGALQLKSLRAFNQSIPNQIWSKAIEIPRFDIENDRSGSVIQAVDRFVQQIPDDLEARIIASLLANTALGFDNVALLNAAHPFSNGTGNNITTNALGFESYRAARASMRLFADEDGRPIGCSPTHLLVGPGNERIAREITGADRPVPYSATAQDATSGIASATTIANAFVGDVTVLVSDKIPGGQWFLMDCSKACKPTVRGVAEELHLTQLVDQENSHTFFTDQIVMKASGYMGFGPGHWATIIGRVAA